MEGEQTVRWGEGATTSPASQQAPIAGLLYSSFISPVPVSVPNTESSSNICEKRKNESYFWKVFGGKGPPESQMVVMRRQTFSLMVDFYWSKLPVYYLSGESGGNISQADVLRVSRECIIEWFSLKNLFLCRVLVSFCLGLHLKVLDSSSW